MHATPPEPLRTLSAAAAVALFFTLVVSLTLGISSNIDSQLVALGESIWPGYAVDIRTDPDEPTCSLEDLDAELAACAALKPSEVGGTAEIDPFADPSDAEVDPFADPPKDEVDPFADPPEDEVDPFADPPEDEVDPFADPPEDEVDPFADPPAKAAPKVDPQACAALPAFREVCATRWEQYNDKLSKRTANSLVFRSIETGVGDLAKFPYWKHVLLLLLILGGISASAYRAHIALREPASLLEHRLQQGTQLVSFLMLTWSNIALYQSQGGGTTEAENPELPIMWAVGFSVLALISLAHLLRPPTFTQRGTTVVRALMVVPLFVYMVIGSGLYFPLVENHPSGQAIRLYKFLQTPSVFVGIGLYIWAGMLFSITRVATLTFGLLRPWKLTPDLLAWLVVALSAIPTAYSGASGIFVLAAGAVIFRELRRSGATTRQALTATAMSGSLGVVLAPCLVVVLIAALNSEVTTSELFGAGIYVFGLTALLSMVAFYLRGQRDHETSALGLYASVAVGVGGLFWLALFPSGEDLARHVAWWGGEQTPEGLGALALRSVGLLGVAAGLAGYQATRGSVGEAMRGMRTPITALAPFVLIGGSVLLVYKYVFGVGVDEHTAMMVLPAALLALVIYDRHRAPAVLDGVRLPRENDGLWKPLISVTAESSNHIGALLMLMAASIALGGLVERSGVMESVPESLGGQYFTMTILVVAMVIIGMTMDALGAVVLVSASLANVAYDAGIGPVHFWMMVLVAFELGYLTPPVALNHLLARQAIGPDAHVEEDDIQNFWARNEHIVLPMAVMGSALVVVAYAPFLFFY